MFRTSFAAMVLAVSVQAHAGDSYPTNDCIASLAYDDRLAAIADKVALGRSDETRAEMFELEQAVTAGEHGALELWSKLRRFCFDLGADFRREMASAQQAALAGRLFELHQGMIGELRDGRVTYAEFNRRRVQIYLIAASLEAQMTDPDAAAVAPEPPLLPAGQSEI